MVGGGSSEMNQLQVAQQSQVAGPLGQKASLRPLSRACGEG